MADGFARSTWKRIQNWFVANATHSTVVFVPDENAPSYPAYESYLRLWLTEGFLAQERQWTANQFAVLHGGVSLSFLGNEPAAFAGLSRPADKWTVPGAQLDFPMTGLLPFSGGTVEIEAALYRATVGGPLGVAVDVLGGLASLLGPPLDFAATVADRISDGLDTVLKASSSTPVLGVHWTLISPGAGGNALRPGHLIIVGKPPEQLSGVVTVVDGRVRMRNGDTASAITGLDYLVLRVECRAERDDWRLPELDSIIRAAGTAFILGQQELYQSRRTEAIVRAWNLVDLTPVDRKRVAKLVRDELDSLAELGVAPAPERRLDVIALERLVSADDPILDGLHLSDLLA